METRFGILVRGRGGAGRGGAMQYAVRKGCRVPGAVAMQM